MRLSLLDFFQPPSALPPIIELADRLGFRRFWIGEHHSAAQCPNPLLACGVFAGLTARMRVGTGAMVLHRRLPYDLAQDARTLTQLYGDCIDLGVTGLRVRGPRGWHWHPPDDRRDTDERRAVELLDEYLRGRAPPGQDEDHGLVWTDVVPKLWLLGISRESAEIAGRLGLGYCSSHHHGASSAEIADAIARYRDGFRPGIFAAPVAIVVRSGICASSEAIVELLVARQRALGQASTPGQHEQRWLLAGRPDLVVEALAELGDEVGADEVMFLSLQHHSRAETRATLAALATAANLETGEDTNLGPEYSSEI